MMPVQPLHPSQLPSHPTMSVPDLSGLPYVHPSHVNDCSYRIVCTNIPKHMMRIVCCPHASCLHTLILGVATAAKSFSICPAAPTRPCKQGTCLANPHQPGSMHPASSCPGLDVLTQGTASDHTCTQTARASIKSGCNELQLCLTWL